jgi:hypothetical protein
VYVIDAKRYHGKIEVLKLLFGEPKLKIAGRDRRVPYGSRLLCRFHTRAVALHRAAEAIATRPLR